MNRDTNIYRRPEPPAEEIAPQTYSDAYEDAEAWRYAERGAGDIYREAPGYDALPEDEDYENEELDNTHSFRIAMNVFDAISVIAGLVVILVLVALLISLVSWLGADVTHSFTLLQTRIG